MKHISLLPTSSRPIIKPCLRLSALAAAIVFSSPVLAQNYLGGIYGKLQSASVASVKIVNPATGYKHTLKPNDRGYYKVTGLAPGTYFVELMRDGSVIKKQTVKVQAGTNTPAVFKTSPVSSASTNNATEMEAVTVNANNLPVNTIDVSTPYKSKIWTSAEYNNLPLLSRGLRSVAVMQSQATVNNAHGGGGVPQFNAISTSSNRYYYNQFDVTNVQDYNSPTTIPDEALQSVQAGEGGFGAKYGDATGAVLSGTVKQGSNRFKAGASLYFDPPSSKLLRQNTHNVYNPITRELSVNNQGRHNGGAMVENYYVSGPIVKDKLFYYILAEDSPPVKDRNYTHYENASSSRGQQILGNFTWNIADGHTLDVLLNRRTDYGYNESYLLSKPYTPGTQSDAVNSWNDSTNATWLGIANYQGRITDSLNVTAMAGFIKTRYASGNSGLSPLLPNIYRTEPTTNQNIVLVPGVSSIPQPSLYYKRGGRIDFEWTQFPDHDIKFGGQYYNSLAVTSVKPYTNWRYQQCNPISPTCVINSRTQPPGTKYVSTIYAPNDSAVGSRNKGVYVSDAWQFVSDWIFYAGLRHDVYTSQNADDRTFLRLPFNSPRLGLSWDVHGDSSLKIGATAGRYAQNIGLNYNVYAGSKGEGFVRTQAFYTYTGMTSDYLPTGLTQIGPVNGSAASSVLSLTQNVSKNIKPDVTDQFTLYAQQRLGQNWNTGVTLYYGKFKRLENNFAADSLLKNYLTKIGYPNASVSSNYLFNPGSSLVIPIDLQGTGEKLTIVTIPNSYLGFEKPRRTTYQVTFTLDHAYSSQEPWYLSASYTWRHEFGNVDGVTSYDQYTAYLSDPGYNRSESVPAFTDGSGGNLNTDNINTLSIWGYYKFAHVNWLRGALHGLRLGGAFKAMTGSPQNCFSSYPGQQLGSTDRIDPWGGYPHAFYCGTSLQKPLSLTPIIYRGHNGRTPAVTSFDIDIGYDWRYGPSKFSADLKVVNVFNTQPVEAYADNFTSADGSYNDLYGQPSYFQGARGARLVFRWDFN